MSARQKILHYSLQSQEKFCKLNAATDAIFIDLKKVTDDIYAAQKHLQKAIA